MPGKRSPTELYVLRPLMHKKHTGDMIEKQAKDLRLVFTQRNKLQWGLLMHPGSKFKAIPSIVKVQRQTLVQMLSHHASN